MNLAQKIDQKMCLASPLGPLTGVAASLDLPPPDDKALPPRILTALPGATSSAAGDTAAANL